MIWSRRAAASSNSSILAAAPDGSRRPGTPYFQILGQTEFALRNFFRGRKKFTRHLARPAIAGWKEAALISHVAR